MDLKAIKELVAADNLEVNKLINASLKSNVELIEVIGEYIINSGGKKIRPLITLLIAKACGYKGDSHITMATAIEYIHTATLLHDDVIDNSSLRRNLETANHKWGNEAAILVGDFLYSKAFQLMMQLNNINVLNIVANATNIIAEGEILQLQQQGNLATTEENYLEIIKYKTAQLFAAATESVANLAKLDTNMATTISQYGMNFGIVYQLVDDILDYSETSAKLGKDTGNDLACGKLTLPLIYALNKVDLEDAQIITNSLHSSDPKAKEKILAILENCGALTYARSRIEHFAQNAKIAIAELPKSKYVTAANFLVDFAANRNF